MTTTDPAHNCLYAHPILFASLGVLHTLLTAGIIFGWASLLPMLRSEGVDLSASDFARIFTHGAIGNYLSTLPFGWILDHRGPKTCGILASLLFGVGLFLCSFATTSTRSLDWGVTLVGFAGPAVQLPTLHLARLFSDEEAADGDSSGGNAAALVMSAQAGAFDGGTFVFALFSMLQQVFGVSSRLLFRLYMAVPAMTLLTAVFFWPNKILSSYVAGAEGGSYVGRSPYLSPASLVSCSSRQNAAVNLVDAPLSVVLSRPPFYCLAIWVSVHILKLNFVVATINDQLRYAMDNSVAETLINIFGAMLPFGFVVLPLVAYLLGRSALACFQIASLVGLLYGSVLTFVPGVASYEILIVFLSVACSRQFVYSTVFHQTGELFGFANYGVLLGLMNVMVSCVSLMQAPLVEWAEAQRDYFWADLVLVLATVPLFVVVLWASPPDAKKKSKERRGANLDVPSEVTPLLAGEEKTLTRSWSDAVILT